MKQWTCYLSLLLIFMLSSCSFFNKNALEIALQQYEEKLVQTPYVSEAGYIETAECDSTYCMYTEGYGYLFSVGYNVPVPVDNMYLLPANMRKSDRSESWLKHIENTHAEAEISFQSEFPPGFSSAYTSFRFFEIRGLFKYLDGFEVALTDSVPGKNGLIEVYRFGNHELYPYAGNIHVNTEDNYITKIEFDNIRYFSEPLREQVQASGFITYYNDDENIRWRSLYIHHSAREFDYRVHIKMGETFFPQKKPDDAMIFRLMDHDRRPFVYYDKNTWNNPFEFDTFDRDEIFADFGGLDSLNIQFEQNDDKPFIEELIDARGKVITVRKSKQTYAFVKQKMEEFAEMFN